MQPIVFISHFRVRAGKLSDYRRIQADVARELAGEKRRTLLFLVYLDQPRERVTAFHVFADAQSMDIHLISSDERSKVGAQFLIPAGWEIYGNASTSTLATVESMAASTGVSLAVHDEFLTGFMRIAPDQA